MTQRPHHLQLTTQFVCTRLLRIIRSMAEDILKRLWEGNRRFACGAKRARRLEICHTQTPFALVFGCADSRVPPELIFDCDLGELFVIRTAGHVLDRAVIASLKFGTQQLGITSLIVLGHTRCGAVQLALATRAQAEIDPAFAVVREQLLPAVQQAVASSDDELRTAIHANIVQTVQQISALEFVTAARERGALHIVGACYDLQTGLVEVIT